MGHQHAVRIDGDASIPIAQLRPLERRPDERRCIATVSAMRYGRMMQAISGVHFNYSFPEHFWPVLADACRRDDRRPGFRFRAVLRAAAQLPAPRLDRAVPVRQFAGVVRVVPARAASITLQQLAPGHAVRAVRDVAAHERSRLSQQEPGGRQISVNSLEDYVRDLAARRSARRIRSTSSIGVKVDGEYRQLNANLLQIENEYYSFIRPKRVARSGERPTKALRRGGVEYVEVRALDVSAFDPVGVNQNKLRFLEAFAALCVLKPREPIDRGRSRTQLDANHATGRASRA